MTHDGQHVRNADDLCTTDSLHENENCKCNVVCGGPLEVSVFFFFRKALHATPFGQLDVPCIVLRLLIVLTVRIIKTWLPPQRVALPSLQPNVPKQKKSSPCWLNRANSDTIGCMVFFHRCKTVARIDARILYESRTNVPPLVFHHVPLFYIFVCAT